MGLVTLQTSPPEQSSKNHSHREGDAFQVTFDKQKRAEKRIKRLRRNVWAAGHLHGLTTKGYRAPTCWFVTLTYAGRDDWRADHISAALEQFRRYCAKIKVVCRYIWVAELQKRGAVHYHLICWLPKGVRMPHWDRSTVSLSGRPIAPLWARGYTNTQVAKTGVGYLMKYLSKIGADTNFPAGLRLYGCGGLTPQARTVRCWYNLPEWAKREHGVGDLKRQGSRLIVRETGEILPAMYGLKRIPGAILLTLLRPMPERWHDGAYSTWRPDLMP